MRDIYGTGREGEGGSRQAKGESCLHGGMGKGRLGGRLCSACMCHADAMQ